MFNFLLHFDKTHRKVDSSDLYVLIKMIQKLWNGDLFMYKCHVHGGVYLFIYLFIYLYLDASTFFDEK